MNAAPLLLLVLCVSAQDPIPLVKVERTDGQERWRVSASETPVRELVRRFAQLAGRDLVGEENLPPECRVSVELGGRPLADVLEYSLGAAGLRAELTADAIVVRPDTAQADSAEARIGIASAAWQRAATRFPAHPACASARLAEGELLELAGREEAASERYLELIQKNPRSRATAEAYLRAGRIAQVHADWAEASELFRALANLPDAEEYRPVARLELARATLELGDPESALCILDSLDASGAAAPSTEKSARQLVRVEALIAANRASEALRVLDQIANSLDPLGAREALRLRARALERAGLDQDASRAWLAVAADAQGRDRAEAYKESARLSLSAKDELGALFAAREATRGGLGESVEPYEREARERLGIATDAAAEHTDETAGDSAARIQAAESALETDERDLAAPLFEALFLERATLAEDQRVRVALGWARCVESSQDIDAAARVLSRERELLRSLEARKRLDSAVAHMFEERALFARAADAYEGIY